MINPPTFIFGFGSTLVQGITSNNDGGQTAYGIILIDTGAPHELGSVPSEEEQKALGVDGELIALKNAGSVLWFTTQEQRDHVWDALVEKTYARS